MTHMHLFTGSASDRPHSWTPPTPKTNDSRTALGTLLFVNQPETEDPNTNARLADRGKQQCRNIKEQLTDIHFHHKAAVCSTRTASQEAIKLIFGDKTPSLITAMPELTADIASPENTKNAIAKLVSLVRTDIRTIVNARGSTINQRRLWAHVGDSAILKELLKGITDQKDSKRLNNITSLEVNGMSWRLEIYRDTILTFEIHIADKILKPNTNLLLNQYQ